MKNNRASYMSSAQEAGITSFKAAKSLNRVPRTHQFMRLATGVARPGKTAKDRAGRGREVP